MNKVFLYLYPIEEFTKFLMFSNDNFYEELGREKPLPILNECIEKRYRDNGYKVVFVLYPDKELFGINKKPEDKIIYTDITFNDVSIIDENGNKKKNFNPKYPNEDYLINQLGEVDELVVGGYHAFDCVLKVAERALERGINSQIDIELTDIFFGIYYQDYFEIDNYDKYRYKEFRRNLESMLEYDDTIFEDDFNEMYSSNAFGYDKTNALKK